MTRASTPKTVHLDQDRVAVAPDCGCSTGSAVWSNGGAIAFLLDPVGNIPPAEKEDTYYRQTSQAEDTGLKKTSLP